LLLPHRTGDGILSSALRNVRLLERVMVTVDRSSFHADSAFLGALVED
jgi:hypothetical protein